MPHILYPKSSVDDGYTRPRTVRLMFLNQAGWRQQKNKPAREPCFHIVTKTGKFLFRHNLHHICFHHYHQYHQRHQTTQPGFKSFIIKPLKKEKEFNTVTKYTNMIIIVVLDIFHRHVSKTQVALQQQLLQHRLQQKRQNLQKQRLSHGEPLSGSRHRSYIKIPRVGN